VHPELRKIFSENSNPEVRSAAAVALGLLQDLESIGPLVAELSAKSPAELRGQCCMALGLMGAKEDKAVLSKLREILGSDTAPGFGRPPRSDWCCSATPWRWRS